MPVTGSKFMVITPSPTTLREFSICLEISHLFESVKLLTINWGKGVTPMDFTITVNFSLVPIISLASIPDFIPIRYHNRSALFFIAIVYIMLSC